jgi:hypothetical protein
MELYRAEYMVDGAVNLARRDRAADKQLELLKQELEFSSYSGSKSLRHSLTKSPKDQRRCDHDGDAD